MKLVVQDANIIIDLIECGIFELFFRLKLEVVTTSLVIGEITEPSQRKACHAAIREKVLHVVEISTLEYLRLQAQDLPGLSVPDRSVIELAQRREALLLSGDGKIRRTAKRCEVKVHGILWVFDQLVKTRLLIRTDAHRILERLQIKNPRLPQSEVERRLKEWGN